MDALIWSDRFVTGMAKVDEQHQGLVTLINAFGELIARNADVPRAELEAVADELIRYAHRHFVDEEEEMRAAGLDPRFLTKHAGEHARFLRDVGQMRASGVFAETNTSGVLLRFLLHWLAFHILGIDMQMARQVERLAKGESAADAYAAEVKDVQGPAHLLLAALDDLMRVIALRNEALMVANATLEARVAQRTAELQRTVDELRSTQVKLVETEKLASVGQLASGLAHEINNPMAFVSANVNALGEHAGALLEVVEAMEQLEPKLPSDARARFDAAKKDADVEFIREDLGVLLEETRTGVTRVQDIVRDLKDFSHVDGERLVDADLKACVEATLKVLSPKLRVGVTFATVFGAVPRLRCQAAQVNQALHGLIVNAAQAVQDTPGAEGRVEVRTLVEGESAVVEVTDTGVGMPADVLSRAFEPFFTTRPPGQGVGLGLSTAYSCAKAHGGTLEARSKVGLGSTFRLVLPLVGAPREAGPRAPGDLSNPFNTRRYSQQ